MFYFYDSIRKKQKSNSIDGCQTCFKHWLHSILNSLVEPILKWLFFVLFLNVTHVGWLCRVSLMLNEGWQFYKYGAVEGQMLLQKHWSTWSWLVQRCLLSLDWNQAWGKSFLQLVATKHCMRRLQGQSPWRSELKGKLAVVHRLPKTLWV